MVNARHPQRWIALHARAADHRVLDGRGERMADVQRARDVRRWLRDHERLARPVGSIALAVRREDISLQPTLVDARLNIARSVGGRHLRRRGGAIRLRLRRLPRDVGRHQLLRTTKRPRSSSGRTRSWYHLLVSLRPYRGHPACAVIRMLSSRAIGRTRSTHGQRSRRRTRSGFQPTAGISGRAGAALLLPVSVVSSDLSKRLATHLERARISIRRMCFDLDSRPPIPPIAGAAVDGKLIHLKASDGVEFSAFHAVPSNPSGAAIMIFPDVRGLYKFYEELALRFAEVGVEALTLDYFARTAGKVSDGSRDDD